MLKKHAASVGICLLLVAATFAVFGQTTHFEFVSFDDNEYVYENQQVQKGLSIDGVKWAFTHAYFANWLPLSTLSHMLDCSLYRLLPGGHHRTNVLLHAAASVALFLALRRMTGADVRSGLVAGLFCLHPLHVESVAWVSERSDVLSGLFFGLTLWAYAAYAQNVSWARYFLVVVLFVLGLLSKSMLVTLPCLLALLDFWPLERWTGLNATRLAILLLEKLPLLALSAASCCVTYVVQVSGSAVTEHAPLLLRLQTALLGYARYIAMLFWPLGLAASYPRDREFYPFATLLCGFALAAISVAVLVCCRRQRQFLLVGWFWFVGTLVPVGGFVVVGDVSVADHYTYLPLTGLFIILVWSAAELTSGGNQFARAAAGCTALALCAAVSFHQVKYWRTSETLFKRALDMTQNNSVAHTNYGTLLMKQGKRFEGEEHFREAVRINKRNYIALCNLGLIERQQGNFQAAVDCYRQALEIEPNFAPARSDLAVTYGLMGRPADAERESLEALRSDPNCAAAENSLALALVTENRYADAIEHFRRAIALGTDNAAIHEQLAQALFAIGSREEGAAEQRNANEVDGGP